jgi:hypothetical protein
MPGVAVRLQGTTIERLRHSTQLVDIPHARNRTQNRCQHFWRLKACDPSQCLRKVRQKTTLFGAIWRLNAKKLVTWHSMMERYTGKSVLAGNI